MSGLPQMTETEEKLRGMGVTMDQRKRLMMASKLGLGPLGIGGVKQPGPPDRSRSPPAIKKASSAMVAVAPGGHLVPAKIADELSKKQAEQAARAHAISRGGATMKAISSAVSSQRADEEDLDSFLAGGRKMAVQAAKVMDERKKKMVIEETSKENLAKSAEGAKKAEAERAEQERKEVEARKKAEDKQKRKLEEKRKKEEEEKQKEEKKRRKEEEKRKKQEEKEKKKDKEESEDGKSGSSDDEKKKEAAANFKQVMKGDETKRMHWGESVKGRVSSDYKGMTDAELEKRFQSSSSKSGEKLMTEQEVLAMLKKSNKSKK